MYISPIRPNYVTPTTTRNIKQQQTKPSFQGALNPQEMERVINLLANKNIKVYENFDIKNLTFELESLIRKYQSMGIRSIGIQIVPNKDLPKLLGKDFGKYNTNGKIGLCAAIGDNEVPIEKMKNIYEARTYLVNENEFSR